MEQNYLTIVSKVTSTLQIKLSNVFTIYVYLIGWGSKCPLGLQN